MEVFKVVLSSLFSAAVLFTIAKIIGHKQMSQLDLFDYITGITIGSIAAELATTLETPWWKPFVSMLVYGSVTVLLSLIPERFPRMRKYINGTPTIIMDNGKLYRKNLKKAKLELSEFLLMCRQEGYFNLDDIQTAIFECNGKLTVLPVSAKRPANPDDIGLAPKPDYFKTEVIMDGRIHPARIEEIVKKDYLQSNINRTVQINKLMDKYRALSSRSDIAHSFLTMIEGVLSESADMMMSEILERYGTYENYMEAEYGFDSSKLNKFREYYLTDTTDLQDQPERGKDR